VTFIDPATTYVDPEAEIAADTVLHPGVVIEGRTRIGAACEIQAYVRISDSEIGDRVTINSFCLISGAQVATGAALGPFAHLRPGTTVGEKAKVGNFVELKNTSLGPRSKANHLSYLGDATVRRPDPASPDAAQAFYDYVYLRDNPSGLHRELWYHGGGCHKWLVVTRNTRTHDISDVKLAEARGTP